VPAYPQTAIREDTVIVIAGTSAQIATVNAGLPEQKGVSNLVLVIGAGRVGQAAAATLKGRGLRVHGVDRSAAASMRWARVSTPASPATRRIGGCSSAPASSRPPPSCSPPTTTR
jgi:heterodisulfide reductase subunit A-like polyferredoxin